MSKLNYHTGVSIHHLGKFALFMTKYIGVATFSLVQFEVQLKEHFCKTEDRLSGYHDAEFQHNSLPKHQ